MYTTALLYCCNAFLQYVAILRLSVFSTREPFTAPGSDPPCPGSRAITIWLDDKVRAKEEGAIAA